MLSDRERNALEQWYSQDKVLAEARRLYEKKADEDLEEYLHMICLFPLSRHSELPEYLKDDKGDPLFPDNLNPAKNLEKWQDAIEVGWEVLAAELGIQQDDVHRAIGKLQREDWDAFIRSVEARKRERGE